MCSHSLSVKNLLWFVASFFHEWFLCAQHKCSSFFLFRPIVPCLAVTFDCVDLTAMGMNMGHQGCCVEHVSDAMTSDATTHMSNTTRSPDGPSQVKISAFSLLFPSLSVFVNNVELQALRQHGRWESDLATLLPSLSSFSDRARLSNHSVFS